MIKNARNEDLPESRRNFIETGLKLAAMVVSG